MGDEPPPAERPLATRLRDGWHVRAHAVADSNLPGFPRSRSAEV